MDIEIDRAVPEDAYAIQEVLHRTWLATYVSPEHGVTIEHINNQFKDAYKPETLETRKKNIATMDDKNTIFVARVDGKVIGLLRVMIEKENNRLRAFYILPEFQGKGIGTKLFEKAKEFFDLDLCTFVNVATYNTSAINFYKKLGFIDTGKRANFEMKDGPTIPEMEMCRE